MKHVGVFVGNVSNDLLNKKIYFDENSKKFFIEGQNIALSKDIIETLNQQKVIKWIDEEEIGILLGIQFITADVDEDIMADIEKYDEIYTYKNIYNITKEDYIAALSYPDKKWSKYLIGLYLLKNNKKDDAFKYLKDFYNDNKLEFMTFKPLLVAKGEDISLSDRMMPLELPKEISNQNIQNKYFEDFLTFDYSDAPRQISKLNVFNFGLTIISSIIFFTTFLITFIKGL